MDVMEKASNEKRLIDADKLLEIYKKKESLWLQVDVGRKTERRTSMRIWTDDEYIEVEPNDVGQLEAAMLFKAKHIKAKADPELFASVADMLSRLWDSATNRVDVVRCRECKFGTHFGDMEDEWIRCMNLHGNPLMPFDGFCSYGERKEGAE